jgi:hypothetical protein
MSDGDGGMTDLKLVPATCTADGLTIDRRKGCYHRSQTVQPGLRKVTCDDCGGELDPLDVLAGIARRSENVTHFDRRRVLAAKRTEEIERRETNARARLRRLGETVPQKCELDVALDGGLRAGIENGRVILGSQYKVLTPDEAERAADLLRKLSWQARKAAK